MIKKLNLLFIILLISIITGIGIFNYIADPYNILHKFPKNIYISYYPRSIYLIVLKLSQHKKYDYIALGSSTMESFMSNVLFKDKKTIYLMTERFDLRQQIKYLDFILSIHPEIKTIIFPIEYPFYYIDRYDKTLPIPEQEEENLTVQEFFRLFLSFETISSEMKQYNTPPKPPFLGWNKEKYKVYNKRNCFNEYMKDFTNSDYSEFVKLKQIIKDRKIIFIIPPYHALVQSVIYEKNLHNEVENIKRYIVNNFTDTKIIDFAFINKYTAEPIETTYNYTDIVHPLGHPGHLFFCVLKYPDKFRDKDIFIQLSKENIEKTLEKQREDLRLFHEKNKSYILDFMQYTSPKHQKKYIYKNFTPPKDCNYYINNY